MNLTEAKDMRCEVQNEESKDVREMTDREPTYADVERLAELYVSYRKRYGMNANGNTFMPTAGGKPIALKNAVLYAHLGRKISVNIFAGEKTSKFICFDIDHGGEEAVRRVVDAICEYGIGRDDIWISSSGGKGYHAELFFDGLVQTVLLKEFYDWILMKTGMSAREVEFRPTHTQSIKLPLSVHPRTGNMCWYLDHELQPIRSIDVLHEIRRIDTRRFAELVAQHRSELADMRTASIAAKQTSGQFTSDSDAPAKEDDCELRVVSRDIEAVIGTDGLPVLTIQGMRHDTMIAIAVQLRRKGYSRKRMHDVIWEWYKRQDASLIASTDAEVAKDLEAILDWCCSPKRTWTGESARKPAVRTCRSAMLSDDDIADILEVKGDAARRILFLLTVRERAGCKIRLSLRDIARVICMSYYSAQRGMENLREKGLVVADNGYRITLDAGFMNTEGTRIAAADMTFDFMGTYLNAIDGKGELTKRERDAIADRANKKTASALIASA